MLVNDYMTTVRLCFLTKDTNCHCWQRFHPPPMTKYEHQSWCHPLQIQMCCLMYVTMWVLWSRWRKVLQDQEERASKVLMLGVCGLVGGVVVVADMEEVVQEQQQLLYVFFLAFAIMLLLMFMIWSRGSLMKLTLNEMNYDVWEFVSGYYMIVALPECPTYNTNTMIYFRGLMNRNMLRK